MRQTLTTLQKILLWRVLLEHLRNEKEKIELLNFLLIFSRKIVDSKFQLSIIVKLKAIVSEVQWGFVIKSVSSRRNRIKTSKRLWLNSPYPLFHINFLSLEKKNRTEVSDYNKIPRLYLVIKYMWEINCPYKYKEFNFFFEASQREMNGDDKKIWNV